MNAIAKKNTGICKSCSKHFTSLNNQLGRLTNTFQDLSSSMEQINKMVGVVRDISAKTDLLALNASIEAARAGHAGKGFAVVAHEVARLAEKAQESIQNVESASSCLEDRIQLLSSWLEESLKMMKDVNASSQASE